MQPPQSEPEPTESKPLETPSWSAPVPTSEDELAESQVQIELNKALRRKALLIMVAGVAAALVGVGILTAIGMQLKTYKEVQQLSDIANTLGWAIAIAIGVFTAYMTAHPVQLSSKEKSSNVVPIIVVIAVIAGLATGVLPGLIILAVYLLFGKKAKAEKQVDGTLILKPVGVGFVILAFIVGLIPGAILAFMVTYPLSTRACELSGSKYC